MPGWKTWGSETLQASDVNDYLMGQAVPRFASTAARDAAITVPDEGQVCFTDSPNTLWIYESANIASAQWLRLWTPWDAWEDPSWSAGVTVGDGTWDVVHRYEGGSLHIRGQFTLGSTSSITAAPQFDLSGYLTANATHVSEGRASLRDTGAGQWYSATAIVGIGFNYALIQATGGSNINSTTPFTWGSGDLITFDLVVTAAAVDDQ